MARSYNNANTNGGVAYVNANNDSSNTNTNNGSRLANSKKSKNSAVVATSDEKDAAKARHYAIDAQLRSLSSLTTPSETVKEVEHHVRVAYGGE